MKRILDLLFSCILFIVLLPLLLAITIIIKFTSKGHVIFTQKRIGVNGKIFNIYKFRTMYIDAPNETPTHLLEEPDKYITPIGKILRKTSLDELPQLINIIKGEMSFVGPRPALYNQYDLIELREQYGVNKLRPGITGWAQVNGRDELEISTKVQYDKYYAENRTLWLDLKIVFLTVYSVILSKGVVEGKHIKRNKQNQCVKNI